MGVPTLQPQFGVSSDRYSFSLRVPSPVILLILSASCCPHQSGATNCPFLAGLEPASLALSSAIHKQWASSRAGPGNYYTIWQILLHLSDAQKAPGFGWSYFLLTKPSTGYRVFYVGDDNLRHTEMAWVTLSKLLSQWWGLGAKPDLSPRAGPSPLCCLICDWASAGSVHLPA